MEVRLSDHFTYGKLLKFVISPILMMIFTSIYGVVDGFFISNFAGDTQFASINLIMPFLMVLGSLGFMIGTGGTAIVSKMLGEGKDEEAKQYFSFFIYITLICGILFTVIGEILIPYITIWFKATPEMYDYCVLYGRIIIATIPAFMLQNVFQTFFSTAEKPLIGFIVTFISGCTNIVLDWVLVGILKYGVAGAAVATCMSQIVGAVLPVIIFRKNKTILLKLGKARWNFKILFNACTNGLSEFVSNISTSIVSIVFNFQLMRLVGKIGVSAYGVMMYVNFIYIAVFIGYSIGTAPIIGYNYGAKNSKELKNIFKKSCVLMGLIGMIMTALALVLADPISKIYVGYNQELCDLTRNAFYIYAFCFIFSGFSIFFSSMFTAFGNGLISALISFLRTIVFQITCVLILPLIWGINGVWVSTLVADILSTCCAMIFVISQGKKYNYFNSKKVSGD